jgi:alkaline phosphatase
VHTREELDRLSFWRNPQVLGVFAPDDFYFASLRPDGSTQPSLAEMTQTAISILNYGLNGYFLVVEHSLVARASERNLGKLAVNEVAEVDEAIATAVAYAGPDALVVVTNSYNLGSLAAPPVAGPGETLPPDADSSRTKASAAPTAALWLDGPGGPATTRAQEEWLRQQYAQGWFSTNAPGLLAPQTALKFQTRALPLADPAWVLSRGDGSLQLRGVFNNTDLYDLLSEQF